MPIPKGQKVHIPEKPSSMNIHDMPAKPQEKPASQSRTQDALARPVRPAKPASLADEANHAKQASPASHERQVRPVKQASPASKASEGKPVRLYDEDGNLVYEGGAIGELNVVEEMLEESSEDSFEELEDPLDEYLAEEGTVDEDDQDSGAIRTSRDYTGYERTVAYDVQEAHEDYLRKQAEERRKSYEAYEVDDSLFYSDDERPPEPLSVDLDAAQVLPLGGKASKEAYDDKLESGSLDKRKNVLVVRKIVQTVIILVLVVFFLLGIKNTYFPEQIYTNDEIAYIALRSVGNTGFPLDKGATVAREFVKAYLEYSPEDPLTASVLSEFYGGEGVKLPKVGSKVKRRIVMGPEVVKVTPMDKYRTKYTVEALITDSDGARQRGSKSAIHRLAFEINLFYNDVTGKMSLSNEPVLVPPTRMDSPGVVPPPKLLGTGELAPNQREFYPTIDGFMQGYCEVSVDNWTPIVQFIPKEPSNDSVYQGFGGAFRIYGDIINREIYETTNKNEWKALVKANLIDQNIRSGKDFETTYPVTYVLTIVKDGDKYLIDKIAGYNYEPKIDQDSQKETED